jgi:O-antigen/teichoic acid export membrane protein
VVPLSEHVEPTDRQPPGLAGVVLRGVGFAGAGYGASQVLTFATYLALAKLVTPTAFGIFAAASTVAGVGTIVGESGMLAALIHRRDRLDEAFNSALLATAAGGILLTLLGVATAPLVGLYFHSHTARDVAAVMAATMFLRLIALVPDAHLQRRFSFFRRVIIDPLSVIAFAAGAVTAGAYGLGVWSLVIGTYAAALVNVVAAWALAGWRPHPARASFAMWRELARYGRSVVGAEFIRRVTMEIPVIALGRFSGTGALGQFTYSFRVATQPLRALVNVGGYVLLPAFSRIATDKERFQAAVLRALRWVSATSFPVGLLLVPLATPAVVLLFGETWREAGYGAMALAGYCAALSLDSLASEAWKAYGRPDMLPRMHGLSLALTTICVGALVPFGLVGVTIGMSVSAIGVAAYAIRGMGKALDMSLTQMQREIWPAAFASVAMGGGLFLLEHFVVKADQHGTVLGLALVAAEAVLGAIVYLGLLSVLAPETTRELAGGATGLARRFTAR